MRQTLDLEPAMVRPDDDATSPLLTLVTKADEGVARPESRFIVRTRTDATSYEDAVQRILAWAAGRESRFVCVASVNNVVEANRNPAFRRVMNQADLVTPDGVPLVWALRLLGVPGASRVCGPELTPLLLDGAKRSRFPVGFYGGSPTVLERAVANAIASYPGLQVAYVWSPPFRPLSDEERRRVIGDVRSSGARLLFIGLGAPKQELLMADLRGEVPAVMVGVGAAFDLLAGKTKRAPRWMQRMGLEWFFRLATEPRRLWKRYLLGNPTFVALFGAQLAKRAMTSLVGGRPDRN